jgi:hypothetical protein
MRIDSSMRHVSLTVRAENHLPDLEIESRGIGFWSPPSPFRWRTPASGSQVIEGPHDAEARGPSEDERDVGRHINENNEIDLCAC